MRAMSAKFPTPTLREQRRRGSRESAYRNSRRTQQNERPKVRRADDSFENLVDHGALAVASHGLPNLLKVEREEGQDSDPKLVLLGGDI